MKITCRVVKNRLSKGYPYKICSYYVKYDEGIVSDLEIPNILIRNGHLRKAGAWLRHEDINGEIINIKTSNGDIPGKWNGVSKFSQFLKENKEVYNYFINLIENSDADTLSDDEVKKIEEENSLIDKNIEK